MGALERYTGQSLGPRAAVAVVANDAIGNFAAATPLLQMLRARGWRTELWTGARVAELSHPSPLVDEHVEVLGVPVQEAWERAAGRSPALVFNMESTPWAKSLSCLAGESGALVCGPAAGPGGRGELPFPDDARGDLWRDRRWASEDLPSRYPFLTRGHISEVFCRLGYLDGPVPRYSFVSEPPSVALPPVLVALSASLPEKLWPLDKWAEVCRALRKAYGGVGLLGAARKAQGQHWTGADDEDRLVEEAGVEDFRGRLRLPEVVGALAAARLVLTLDNGILHLASAGDAPVVGLFRHGIHWLWCPHRPGLEAVVAEPGGTVADIPTGRVFQACGL